MRPAHLSKTDQASVGMQLPLLGHGATPLLGYGATPCPLPAGTSLPIPGAGGAGSSAEPCCDPQGLPTSHTHPSLRLSRISVKSLAPTDRKGKRTCLRAVWQLAVKAIGAFQKGAQNTVSPSRSQVQPGTCSSLPYVTCLEQRRHREEIAGKLTL